MLPAADGSATPSEPPDPGASSERADFSFDHVLGCGTFGEVWKVTRHVDQAPYVIKLVPTGALGDREQQDARNEVRLLSAIDHPRVVCYLDSFVEGAKLHIVMEFCAGGDLHQLLEARRGALLPEASVWRYLLQTAEGLAHLHGLKILHRDLKTSNLFLTGDGPSGEPSVKIGDLGVSRLMGTATEFAQTMVGTPYYLSPELCENAPYNEKSDVWALGVVAYELATLGFPFVAHNREIRPVEHRRRAARARARACTSHHSSLQTSRRAEAALIVKILRGAYEPIGDHFSPRLRRLVAACLSPTAAARPHAADLLRSLPPDLALLLSIPLALPPDRPSPPEQQIPSSPGDAAGTANAADAAFRPTPSKPPTPPPMACPQRRPVASAAVAQQVRRAAAPCKAAPSQAATAGVGNRSRRVGSRQVAAGGGLSAARQGVHDARRRADEKRAAEEERRVQRLISDMDAHDARVAAHAPSQCPSAAASDDPPGGSLLPAGTTPPAVLPLPLGAPLARPGSARGGRPTVAMLQALEEEATFDLAPGTQAGAECGARGHAGGDGNAIGDGTVVSVATTESEPSDAGGSDEGEPATEAAEAEGLPSEGDVEVASTTGSDASTVEGEDGAVEAAAWLDEVEGEVEPTVMWRVLDGGPSDAEPDGAQLTDTLLGEPRRDGDGRCSTASASQMSLHARPFNVQGNGPGPGPGPGPGGTAADLLVRPSTPGQSISGLRWAAQPPRSGGGQRPGSARRRLAAPADGVDSAAADVLVLPE